LTCRVGRAVYGTTDIIKDLIESGKSLLILGRPGVGKTTMLREAARILADSKRVVIVDTSNEIGGDGDVPHPAVGRARRMQVSMPALQHEVMIESVTLSDEEARRRGTQKTVLERRSPPTFDVLIEIQTRDRLAIHPDVAASVDAMLRGYPLQPEIRSRDERGEIQIERAPAPVRTSQIPQQGFRRQNGVAVNAQSEGRNHMLANHPSASRSPYPESSEFSRREHNKMQPIRIYPYGVARNRLMQAAKRLGVPAIIVNESGEAEVLVTLRSYYRKRQQTVVDAERRNIPIYVLRANTVNQMQQFLSDLFSLSSLDQASDNGLEPALQETQAAIEAVLNGERWVELAPAVSSIRRLQHQMAREANLISHSYGKEPRRRVRIFRE
jgi:energy-coupling factor transporter ATP-binding protein EcfA2